VRYQKIWFRWLLAATVVISVFVLAACKSSSKKAVATDSKSATEDNSKTTQASTPLTTQAPTAEPIVLDGAINTNSGLQYLEITVGDGASPKAGDIVKMNYIASLPDGTEIYNTYTVNQPASAIWGRDQLLPGWDEGLGLMKAGGKAKFILPPELAFGAEGRGIIPANSQIVMEVELLSVKPAPSPSSVAPEKLQKMDNGLQYYDLILGDGTEAITNTSVSTHYSIWVKGDTADDFIFSSEDEAPLTFTVGLGDTVFAGWEQGVTGMKVGGKRLLIIPPELALGSQSSGSIPANATLIMEIFLTNVKEPMKATQVDESDYITAASGLKYYDIQVGTGVTPTVGQTVVVNYVGWLEDGTQFDSSYDRGQTFSFILGTGNVISGWDLGVAGMKVGGKRQLVIPSALGYGDSGSGSTIPPGATLIFEVELLEIKP
jgi:peptidylprolyl isomerase